MIKKIPYTLKIIFPILGWTGLCGFFAYELIDTTAKLNTPGASYFFLYLLIVTGLILLGLTILKMGNLISSSKGIRIINKNISKGVLNSKINPEEAKETFYYLVHFCRNNFTSIIWIGLFFSLLVTGIMKVFKGVSNTDALIIISGGIVATILSAVFASFYSEQATFKIVKDLRQKIIEAGDQVPDINFDSIGSKFYFLFIFPIITTIIVLICVFPFGLNVAILSLIGMLMVLIIDRVFFIYIAKSFFEVENFVKEMVAEKKEIFTTGSVDKEFISLINELNKAGEKVIKSKKESFLAKEEMESRTEELEKFFNIAVNREMKMVELKKQLEKTKTKEKIKE